MGSNKISRRKFVGTCLSTAAISAIPGAAFSQTVKQRLEWQAFIGSPNYQSFLNAISIMRANTNASDRNSWAYWTNAHVNYCPHGIAYFLAWHRGYLYYFERQLQLISGNSALTLPYWDYYKYPTMPAQFTTASSGNPLYVESRVGTNVYDALTMAPFSPTLTNFQRGTTNAFEPSVESAPHNPVHNLIGGFMATMQSPQDPIFWVHHANIDRLWAAWVAANSGRRMPNSGNSYWNGSFTYATSLTLNRRQTYNTTGLGYTYPDLTLPSTFPPNVQAARIIRAQFQSGNVTRPGTRAYPVTPPQSLGQDRRALGGVRDVALSEQSVTASLPVEAANRLTVKSILNAVQGSPFSPADTGPYKSVQLVFDDLRLTELGRRGGYFYKIYLNLPAAGDASALDESNLVGTLGPFEIDGATHHGNTARLVYPITRQLASSNPGTLQTIDVSLVRVSARNAPLGQTITVGEVRVEISGDEIE